MDATAPDARRLAGLPAERGGRGPISVVMVDDHPLVREHLGGKIEADPRLRLAAATGDGAEGQRLIEELRPDAIVLEVELPGLDGAGLLRWLRARGLPVCVLVFTGHARPGPLYEVLHAGPDSLLPKGTSSRMVCGEIVAMVRGAPSRGRFNRESAQAVAYQRLRLDETERIVLEFARQERPVAELAARLGVSVSKAKEHRRELCKKFEVDTTLGAVAKAIRIGLIE
jgi:DNA-binding NarL/FixJ family response regulator